MCTLYYNYTFYVNKWKSIFNVFFTYNYEKTGVIMRLCELKQKEIINTCTCRCLGSPMDIEFDCATGRITALIVPGPGRFCSFFGRESEYVIPWNCICQIGDDIILVEIKEEKCLRKDRQS